MTQFKEQVGGIFVVLRRSWQNGKISTLANIIGIGKTEERPTWFVVQFCFLVSMRCYLDALFFIFCQ